MKFSKGFEKIDVDYRICEVGEEIMPNVKLNYRSAVKEKDGHLYVEVIDQPYNVLSIDIRSIRYGHY